jgi:Protein of unknown function (DUF3047)
VLLHPVAFAQVLTAFSSAQSAEPPAPWRPVGFPKGKIPATQFDIHDVGSEKVLRVRADKSYGTLSHPWSGPAKTLSWRWRVEDGLPKADLRTKAGDDSPAKVCVMFDMPLDGLPLGERNKMRFARFFSGEPLPAATLCYAWDHQLPVGAELANPYTQRVRVIVVDSGDAQPGQWQRHSRDIAADFKRAFGHESASVPPVIAILVGADADNTQGTSLSYVADITLKP